jgi:hypothetical protein
MYNVLGICLAVAVTIMVYKVYIISRNEMGGTARTG